MAKNLNSIKLQGIVSSEPVLDEELKYGEKIYSFTLSVPRESGTDDVLILRASNRLVGFDYITDGAIIEVSGDIRTRREKHGFKKRMKISIFCYSIDCIEAIDTKRNNVCEISGTVGKKPLLRKAKTSDRVLCEVQVRVQRPRNKMSFIPVISWGRNAYYSSEFKEGDEIYVIGRFQSRNILRHSGVSFEEDTTYELSAENVEYLDKVVG